MSSEPKRLTLDEMIRNGLAGKDRAIFAYDEILWKVRAGYAAVLYGVFTVVLGLGDKTKWTLPVETAALVALTLITGFTICAAVLDFSFLRGKYRVVQSKEELLDLALAVAAGKDPSAWKGAPLEVLLRNSGEGLAAVRWRERPSLAPIALLYLGTWGPLCLAVAIMWK